MSENECSLENKNELTIIWTSADPLTSHHMVLLYATNAKLNGWFDEVMVVLWGASQKYAVEDEKIQERIKIAKQAGVRFSSCVSCSNNLQLTSGLAKLEIETIRWGEKLSNLLKNKENVITL